MNIILNLEEAKLFTNIEPSFTQLAVLEITLYFYFKEQSLRLKQEIDFKRKANIEKANIEISNGSFLQETCQNIAAIVSLLNIVKAAMLELFYRRRLMHPSTVLTVLKLYPLINQ